MEPLTITEQLMYSTVRLEYNNSCGTGFFFTFNIEGKKIPIIITNSHVVGNQKKATITFFLHIRTADSQESSIPVKYDAEWFHHSKQDLCFCFAAPVLSSVTCGKTAFYRTFEESLIWTKKKLEELSAVEDVFMIGYPNALWNESANLPLFRRGITANHPAIEFRNASITRPKIGVIDIACFGGSSGSPIIILNENGYSDKKGNIFLGSKRIVFLGILFSGPIMQPNGNIEIIDIPTVKSAIYVQNTMLNLGYYVWAEEILEFKNIVETLLRNN